MKRNHLAILVALATIAVLGVATWVLSRGPGSRSGSPRSAGAELPSPPLETIGPFHVGVSSLDVEENERAGRLFQELSRQLPREPAVWANLGIAHLRLGNLTGAEEALATSARLAPANQQITVLQAMVDEFQGQFARAIERLRGLSEPDAPALHQLAELLGRTGREEDLTEQLAVLDRLRERAPDNLVVAFNRARLLARIGDAARLSEAIRALEIHRETWSPPAAQQFESARAAVAEGNFRAAATHLAFLQNLNLPSPGYQTALAALGAAGGSLGHPIRGFIGHAAPEIVVAPPDDSLEYVIAADADVGAQPVFRVAVPLGGEPGASLLSLANGTLRINRGTNQTHLEVSGLLSPARRSALCAADLNGDFLQDLALITGDGLNLWLQSEDGRFDPLLPGDDIRAAFQQAGHGVWPLDFEADGDLDLLIAREGSAPQILRNNGDGGFTPLDALAAFPEPREVLWADLDGDGDTDLALLDIAGRVMVSWNERSGAFAVPVSVLDSTAVALACADLMAIGELRIAILGRDGVIRELGFNRQSRTWSARDLARWLDPPDLEQAWQVHRASIAVEDLDNNGALDIITSAGARTALWLNEGESRLRPLGRPPALFVMSVTDLNGDGLMDLVGLTQTGPTAGLARASRNYHWQSIQTRALATLADGRINSFGIGGRIEVRAGPLLMSAPITAPATHFGLGTQPQAGVARIVWPNGVAQVEFDLKADQQITAVQRLKGSCPWVFTRCADGFRFVKDFIWRSPLGMRINSQDTAGIDQTEDWILIPGDLLTPHDQSYEIRITAELWETHFFDHISLRAVDHPKSIAALVDERFVANRQPELTVIGVTHPQPFQSVRDGSGRDVSVRVESADGHCVDDFPLGRFQGIAGEHWIEFELPAGAPTNQPLVIVGHGWIYPTDSSLNVAISQGSHPAPRGLVLEGHDPALGWRTLSGDLGFPAGKNKTVVIPFPDQPLRAGLRRYRLRTNLEVYWDRLAWAVAVPDPELRMIPLVTLTAELRHRGFSKVAAPARRKPDLPRYDHLIGTGPRWRDLEGYYTRFGDVRELLHQIDDRYVIMNAGDEFILRFNAPEPPPPGWTRDFVLVGDGWVKDGDFNTASSRTVRPLPSHLESHYGGPAQPLEEDPVFQRHIDDWRRFHTRYVTPTRFDRGLMQGAPARKNGGTL
jgi:Flp pilus assembly protein TadD